MKNLILFLTLIFSGLSFSQSSSDVGKIALHVVMPEANSSYFENMGSKELKKVRSKITSIISKNGIGVPLWVILLYTQCLIFMKKM